MLLVARVAQDDCHKFIPAAALSSASSDLPASGIKIVRSFLRYYSNCPVSFNDRRGERFKKKSPLERERSEITGVARAMVPETGNRSRAR